MNIVKQLKEVNIDSILNSAGTDANFIYASCHTQKDKDEMKKFAEKYLCEFFFIKDIGGKPAILKPKVRRKTIFNEDGTQSTRETQVYVFLSLKDFKDANIKDYFEIKQENKYQKMELKKIQYADFWLETKTDLCRQFETTVFDPNPSFNDDTVFNMWSGYVEPIKGDVQPFLNHIHKLLGNEEAEKHLIDTLAYTVRFPHKQTGTAIVLMGKQGCGKTTVSESIRACCPAHSNVVADLQRDLLGQFNDEYANTKYFLHEESSWAGDKALANKLKDMITGETRKTGIKFMSSVQMDNYGFHIFTSNSDNPINVENNDRRFNVFECADTLIGNKKHFDEFYAWLNSTGKNALVHYFQNERDLSGFNPKKIFKSKAHDLVKANNLSPINKYLLELLRLEQEWTNEIEEGSTVSYKWTYNDIKINRNIAYDGFVSFCQKHGESNRLKDITQSKFTSELAKIFKFPENFNSNWKKKGVGFYKIPLLREAREMFSAHIGSESDNLFDLTAVQKLLKQNEKQKKENL